MKNRRDILILAGLFAALIAFVALGPRLRPPEDQSNVPTTYGEGPNGALALYTWLGDMGYDARRLAYREFALEEADAALVMLNPSEPIDEQQADATLEWVEQGGTLILADDTPALFSSPNALLDALNVELAVYTDTNMFTAPIGQARPAQPALDQPPTGEATVRTSRVVLPNRNDYVALMSDGDAVVLAGIKRGRGYIYLSAASYPFTNEGLRDGGNNALVLNLLRRVPAGGRVQFDEIHHGYIEPPSTTSTIWGSPLGWAAAYATLATALYLVLSGRRFGRPVPLKAEVARRSSAEYVESMADLLQRGGKRGYVLGHYHTALKRRLARRAGVNPKLDDAEFVRELARFRSVDEAALLALLARLRNERAGEDALVRAVAEAEATLQQELARR